MFIECIYNVEVLMTIVTKSIIIAKECCKQFSVMCAVLLILVSQRVEIVTISYVSEAVKHKDKIDRELRGSSLSLVEWIILAYVVGNNTANITSSFYSNRISENNY